ncbi:MAG: endonuclease III [bacterium]
MTNKQLEKAKEVWKLIGPVLLKKYKRDKNFLDYTNPFELLIAVILSAQTTDEGVNKITPMLFAKYGTPEKMAKAKIEDLQMLVQKVNYNRVKAGYIQKTAKTLSESFGGKVPLDVEQLQTLSGVGRKTAIAVMTNLSDTPYGIPVDTHVLRFVKRFNLTKNTDPNKVEQDLLQIIPKKDWKRAGYATKEYGRKEGKARPYKPELDPLMDVYKKMR